MFSDALTFSMNIIRMQCFLVVIGHWTRILVTPLQLEDLSYWPPFGFRCLSSGSAEDSPSRNTVLHLPTHPDRSVDAFDL
jgi:hypothetical protein